MYVFLCTQLNWSISRAGVGAGQEFLIRDASTTTARTEKVELAII